MYPNLKLHMWRSGVRQNRLAQILEMDETALSRIVNGFRRPGPELKRRIAAALGTDEAWLFEEANRDCADQLAMNGELLVKETKP
jgi:transcriptional regulator with XRE-family HTH domain